MKLFDYCHYEDFGHEWYFQVLPCYPKFALIDLVIQWDDFPSPELLPFLIVGFGPKDIGFSFRWLKFELRCDFFDFEPRNLATYRRYKSGDYR